jgi:hypothetical protein
VLTPNLFFCSLWIMNIAGGPGSLRRIFCLHHVPLTAFLLFAAASASHGKTVTVTNGRDHGLGSLRAAIANAAAGDTIEFAEGLRAVNLTTAPLSIYQDLQINGPGANLLTVRRKAAVGIPAFRVFHIFGPARVTLSGLTIANGLEQGTGAGIDNESNLVLSGCAVSHNKGQNGGGIFNRAILTIKACTISDNSAEEGTDGGGICNGGEGEITISRSTIARNSAHYGGGIANFGLVTITNSTVAANAASGTAGGIYNAPGGPPDPIVVRARNTIVASNTATSFPDFAGRFRSMGYNLIGSTAGIVEITGDKTGNQRNVDPLLGVLRNNGGPTMTLALHPGSPAIDKGDSGAAVADQRGSSRPVDDPNLANAQEGNGADIGAFEVQPADAGQSDSRE